ncbi:MAG: alpha/beta hydrolase fold domain-containing protein [Bacteroidota bacterium]
MKKISIIILIAAMTGCSSQSTSQDRPMKPPKGYMNETFIKIAYGLGMLDLIESEPAIPDEIQQIKDITYKRIDGIELQLDIYRKKDLKGPTPTMIFIHGGAWKKGKRQDYLPYLVDYAKKGYITATISYRLTNQAPFPAAAQDVSCGIKWIKEHADDYGIDPDRIALVGGSAGGHLALLIGYGGEEALFNEECDTVVTNAVKAVVDFYGPVDLTTPYAISVNSVYDFLDAKYDENPDVYLTASPKTYISSDNPPTLIFQGTIDSLVPVSQSDSLEVWLDRSGVPNDYHRLKGWPHTMDAIKEVNEYCQFYIDRFLEKYL